MKNFLVGLLVLLVALVLTGCPARKDPNSPAAHDQKVENSETETVGTDPAADDGSVVTDTDTAKAGSGDKESSREENKVEAAPAPERDPIEELESMDFGEPSNDSWKEEAGLLATVGYQNLGEITRDYRAFRLAKAKSEIWNERRSKLAGSVPRFAGSEANFNQQVEKFGPMAILSEEDIENPHVPGQIDQIQELGMPNIKARVYKANLDPVKYLILSVEISGPVGVEEIDRLFSMSQAEIFHYYGELLPMENVKDRYLMSNPMDLMEGLEGLAADMENGRVKRIVFSGYVD